MHIIFFFCSFYAVCKLKNYYTRLCFFKFYKYIDMVFFIRYKYFYFCTNKQFAIFFTLKVWERFHYNFVRIFFDWKAAKVDLTFLIRKFHFYKIKMLLLTNKRFKRHWNFHFYVKFIVKSRYHFFDFFKSSRLKQKIKFLGLTHIY